MAREEILLPLDCPDFYKGTHVQITVIYDKGGSCLATFRNKPRGYYLSVGIIGIGTEGLDANCRSFGLFSAPTVLIEETKRLNGARLIYHRAAVQADVVRKQGKVWELVQQVLSKDGRALAELQVSNS